MGTRYKVSETESVNYSKKATEDDAKKLGEALKANGYFSGKQVYVLLSKDEKEGTVVSFVGSWDWKGEKIVAAFKQMGEEIAAGGLGKPLTVRLLDSRMNTRTKSRFRSSAAQVLPQARRTPPPRTAPSRRRAVAGV